MLSNAAAKRSPAAGVPKPPPRADSLLLRGDDSGVATSADAPSCSGEYDEHDPRYFTKKKTNNLQAVP